MSRNRLGLQINVDKSAAWFPLIKYENLIGEDAEGDSERTASFRSMFPFRFLEGIQTGTSRLCFVQQRTAGFWLTPFAVKQIQLL